MKKKYKYFSLLFLLVGSLINIQVAHTQIIPFAMMNLAVSAPTAPPPDPSGHEVLLSGTSWIVPAGVTRLTEVAAWGGGAGGAANRGSGRRGAGGGGAVSVATNVTVTPGQVMTYSIGAGGVGESTAVATSGGDTTFTGSVIIVRARGGSAGTGGTGGAGGLTSGATGSLKYAGGTGGTGTATSSGAGGGSAASDFAAGTVGGAGTASGGGNGGNADNAGLGGYGGDNTYPADPGQNHMFGGGGGGGGDISQARGDGGNGGIPGGGGGAASSATGSSAVNKGGNGGQGAIYIQY